MPGSLQGMYWLGRFELSATVDDFAGDDCGRRPAFELTAVEGRIAGFAGGVFHAVGPGTIKRKNREVGGFAGSKLAFLAEDARGASGKEFDHAHQ